MFYNIKRKVYQRYARYLSLAEKQYLNKAIAKTWLKMITRILVSVIPITYHRRKWLITCSQNDISYIVIFGSCFTQECYYKIHFLA